MCLLTAAAELPIMFHLALIMSIILLQRRRRPMQLTLINRSSMGGRHMLNADTMVQKINALPDFDARCASQLRIAEHLLVWYITMSGCCPTS